MDLSGLVVKSQSVVLSGIRLVPLLYSELLHIAIILLHELNECGVAAGASQRPKLVLIEHFGDGLHTSDQWEEFLVFFGAGGAQVGAVKHISVCRLAPLAVKTVSVLWVI